MSRKNIYPIIPCICIAAFVCCCAGNDVSQIVAYHSSDLKLNFSQTDYFIDENTYYNYINTLRKFNPNTEYHKDILKDLSAKNIKSRIREVCSMHFGSNLISIYVQFPNRKTYNKFLNKFKGNSLVSKKNFAKLLKYEYSFSVNSTGFGWNSDNYIRLYENSAYKGEAYHHLSEENARYFFSNNFTMNMDAISAWVKEEKWNDPNSAMQIIDGIYSIHTTDSESE